MKFLVFSIHYRYFLAGGICASFSHGIAVPFDVVKTRLQTSTTAEFLDTNVISGMKLISVSISVIVAAIQLVLFIMMAQVAHVKCYCDNWQHATFLPYLQRIIM